MKVIFIAGSYGSGTSAITGILDKMGVSSLPPHFLTNDYRTPNSFESIAFRDLVISFADETTLTKNMSKAAEFIQGLKKLVQQGNGGTADAVVLKMPLASICITQIIEAVDPYIIMVHRPIEEIEASRIRRGWDSACFGAAGAQVIYSRLITELMQMKKSYLAISYHDLQKDPRREMLRVTNFCDLSEINNRIDGAIGFVRGRA
jgi:hypothetical protein